MPGDDQKFLPAYLKLSAEERSEKVKRFNQIMHSCTFCPRSCRVDRLQGERGQCGVSADLYISSAGPHFGEERELVGGGGSGTIFFSNCNLACIFCQNWTISRGMDTDSPGSVEELAKMMLNLQKRGCSNINLVTPTPYLYHITAAIDRAAGAGLSLPVVYNCGGYESAETLKLLEGFIDIYMPDAKYGSDRRGETYSGVKDYFSRLKEALKEMQRQVGDLKIGSGGLAYQGLLIRHLVLPDNLSESEIIARIIKEEISPHCAVNVMAQYYPAYQASKFPPLNRRLSSLEYSTAREAFQKAGLRVL